MIKTSNEMGRSEFVNATTVIPREVNTITVRGSIICTFPEHPEDATSNQTLKLIEQSGTLDFWQDKVEDIYTHDDGEQI